MADSGNNLRSIYLMHSLDALAFSLIGIFVPIFLMIQGSSFRAVMVYCIIHNLVLAAMAFLAAILAGRIGLKNVVLLRWPFLFFYLGLLAFWPELGWPLWILAGASGLQAALYWIPMNILFGRYVPAEKMGQEIGKLSVYPQIAGVAGPIAGALVAQFLGFRPLFALTFAISLTAAWALVRSGGFNFRYDFRIDKGWDFFRRRPKLVFWDMADNFGGEAEGVIWPIIIFLTAKNLSTVGLAGALLALGGILFTVFVGKLADKIEPRRIVRFAALLLLANWLIRSMVVSDGIYLLTTLLAGFLLTLLAIPYTAFAYRQAKAEMNEEFYVVKELVHLLGRIPAFLLAIFLAEHFDWFFIVSGLSYLAFLF